MITFVGGKSSLTSTQVALIKAIKLAAEGSVKVVGYSSATVGGLNLPNSLDRALNVKAALLKSYPGLAIKTSGGGTKKVPICSRSKYQCAVITYQKWQ